MPETMCDVLLSIADELQGKDAHGHRVITELYASAQAHPEGVARHARGDLVTILRATLTECFSYKNLSKLRLSQGLPLTQDVEAGLWQHSLAAKRIAEDLHRFVYVN